MFVEKPHSKYPRETLNDKSELRFILYMDYMSTLYTQMLSKFPLVSMLYRRMVVYRLKILHTHTYFLTTLGSRKTKIFVKDFISKNTLPHAQFLFQRKKI